MSAMDFLFFDISHIIGMAKMAIFLRLKKEEDNMESVEEGHLIDVVNSNWNA